MSCRDGTGHNEAIPRSDGKYAPNPTRKTSQQIIAGDLNAGLGPGIVAKRISVGQYTLNTSNKRGDRLKYSLMIQNFVALITVFKKRPDKQATFC